MSDTQPTKVGITLLRIYAVVLLVIGIALAAGGTQLVSLGGSPYYVLSGIAVVISAILLWRRQATGALLYGAMLLATVAWALWESGANGWALLPRIFPPMVLGIVLLLPVVRRVLVRQSPPWPFLRTAAAAAGAVIVGYALHAVVPPYIPADPLYQTGMGTPAAPRDATVSDEVARGDWTHFGNDAGGHRFSPLTQITPENIGQLKEAWSYEVANTATRLQATPIKIGDVLYTCSGTNDIIALYATTGEQIWRFDAKVDVKKATHPSCRGVAYYKAPEATGTCAERIITNTIDARLIAVDAKDGKPCADFGTNGETSLLTGMGEVIAGYYYTTSAPTIVRGKVVLGGWVADNQYWGEPSGVIRAFDAVTGKFAWAWDMGAPDRVGEPQGDDSYTHSTPNSWGVMSADENLGMVFLPTGNPTPDYYGAQRRPFDDEFGSSVVALDAETGRLRWSFQIVHHDLWDLDNATQPSLIDFPTPEGVKAAVLVPNKRGELFVLDRVTGKPLIPVEERPVPQNGGAPGDRLSPTQPFSTAMPSFRGPDVTETQMWGITPLDQLWCRIKFKEARYDGTLTPPGLTPAIHVPGFSGGMNWGSAAIDPTRQIAIINNTILPIYTRLIPRDEADKMGLTPMTAANAQHYNVGQLEAQKNTPYGIKTGWFMSPLFVPCTQPPFGRISGVDLSTGKLLWTKPLGEARDQGPLGIRSRLPITIGLFNTAGSVVTQSGLTFIASAGDRYLRAYETATGKQVWKTTMSGSGIASPMTYQAGGRQFVVISVSGTDGWNVTGTDRVVAFALPAQSK